MRIFLDSSVLLAAAGSDAGASRHLFLIATARHWKLITSEYAVAEVQHNLYKLGGAARDHWDVHLLAGLQIVSDTLVLDKPLSLLKAKDRPILITALTEKCPVLLTLDREDFGPYFEHGVYGMKVMTPGQFLREHPPRPISRV